MAKREKVWPHQRKRRKKKKKKRRRKKRRRRRKKKKSKHCFSANKNSLIFAINSRHPVITSDCQPTHSGRECFSKRYQCYPNLFDCLDDPVSTVHVHGTSVHGTSVPAH